MIRLTPVWTRSHTFILVAFCSTVFGTVVVAWGQDTWVAFGIAALFVATAAAGLSFDVFIASACGFAGAAGAIALKQFHGTWGEETFAYAVLEVVLFLITGWATGMAGTPLRTVAAETVGEQPDELFAHSGSLGLLPPGAGESRLEEEVERAEIHKRPLSLLRVRTEIRRDVSVSEIERVSIYRVVARLVEGMLRPTDIPFAYEDNSVIAILPEMQFEDSWELVGPLLEALGRATFVVRPEGHRHHARDYADVQLSIVSYPEHGRTLYELLEASLEAISDSAGRSVQGAFGDEQGRE